MCKRTFCGAQHFRENVGERLGFLGRVMHGRNPRGLGSKIRDSTLERRWISLPCSPIEHKSTGAVTQSVIGQSLFMKVPARIIVVSCSEFGPSSSHLKQIEIDVLLETDLSWYCAISADERKT